MTNKNNFFSDKDNLDIIETTENAGKEKYPNYALSMNPKNLEEAAVHFFLVEYPFMLYKGNDKYDGITIQIAKNLQKQKSYNKVINTFVDLLDYLDYLEENQETIVSNLENYKKIAEEELNDILNMSINQVFELEEKRNKDMKEFVDKEREVLQGHMNTFYSIRKNLESVHREVLTTSFFNQPEEFGKFVQELRTSLGAEASTLKAEGDELNKKLSKVDLIEEYTNDIVYYKNTIETVDSIIINLPSKITNYRKYAEMIAVNFVSYQRLNSRIEKETLTRLGFKAETEDDN